MAALRRFRVLLPVVWGLGCLLSFRFPGDEYSLFAIGSIAGVWAVFFVSGDVRDVLVPVLLSGCLLSVGLGFVLDHLRGSPKVWLVAWPVLAAVVFFVWLSGFESTEAAVAKHGSLLALVLCASQLGHYGATVVTLVAAAVRRYLAMLGEDLARQRS